MTKPFLIEVGCEEIPGRFLTALAEQWEQNIAAELRQAGLMPEEDAMRFAYTPRRLAAWTAQVLERQQDREEETIGPPVKAAYNAAGAPTPAAVNFAKKFGSEAKDLYKVSTPKGEYVALRRHIPGKTAAELLPEILLRAWNQLDQPRAMQWDESGFKFLRPVRWLVALLVDEIIPVRLGEIASGRITRGHRTLGSQEITLDRADGEAYLQLLEKNYVLAEPEARRARIREGLQALVSEPNLRAVDDEELLEILVNLTEYPTVIRGEFEREYLQLPREVLVTVMRNHQRYFAMEEKGTDGAEVRLAPGFLAVANQDQDRDGLIRQGHERVLRARFNDALFFWNSDRKRTLESRLEDLKHIMFHAKLGSYYDKTQRMLRNELISYLAFTLGIKSQQQQIHQAIQLSKCDLGTDLVKEFTELQGQIGGLIAQSEGQDEVVWQAIYNHYLPVSSEDKIPRNLVGAAVALADKLDTLAGMFGMGEIPSGSRDPYALRRAGNGVVRILIEHQRSLSLKSAFIQHGMQSDQALFQLRQFFAERQEFYLHDIRGFPKEEVLAVLNAIDPIDPLNSADNPLDAYLRLQALHEVRGEEPAVFAQAAEVFKRLRNIVRQAGELNAWSSRNPSTASFRHDIENELHRQLNLMQKTLPSQSAEYHKDYLLQAAKLSPLVERYFNEVRVNDPDPMLRENRLAFLAQATVKLGNVADLSLLAPVEK